MGTDSGVCVVAVSIVATSTVCTCGRALPYSTYCSIASVLKTAHTRTDGFQSRLSSPLRQLYFQRITSLSLISRRATFVRGEDWSQMWDGPDYKSDRPEAFAEEPWRSPKQVVPDSGGMRKRR